MEAYHQDLLDLCEAYTAKITAPDANISAALAKVMVQRYTLGLAGPLLSQVDGARVLLEHACCLLRAVEKQAKESQAETAAWITCETAGTFLSAISACWQSFTGPELRNLELAKVATRSGVLQHLAAAARSITAQAAATVDSTLSEETVTLGSGVADAWSALAAHWPGKVLVGPAFGQLSQAVVPMAVAMLSTAGTNQQRNGLCEGHRSHPLHALNVMSEGLSVYLVRELSKTAAGSSEAQQWCSQPHLQQAVATGAVLLLMQIAAAAAAAVAVAVAEDRQAAVAAAASAVVSKHQGLLAALHMGTAAEVILQAAVSLAHGAISEAEEACRPETLCCQAAWAADAISTCIELAAEQLSRTPGPPAAAASSSSRSACAVQAPGHPQQQEQQQDPKQQQQQQQCTIPVLLPLMKLLLDLLLAVLPVEYSIRLELQQQEHSSEQQERSSDHDSDGSDGASHSEACQHILDAMRVLQGELRALTQQKQQEQQKQQPQQQGEGLSGAPAAFDVLLQGCSCLETAIRACSTVDNPWMAADVAATADSTAFFPQDHKQLTAGPEANIPCQFSVVITCCKAVATAGCCCCSHLGSISAMDQASIMKAVNAAHKHLGRIKDVAARGMGVGRTIAAAAAGPAGTGLISDSTSAGLVVIGRSLYLLGDGMIRCNQPFANTSLEFWAPPPLSFLPLVRLSAIGFVREHLQQLQLPGVSAAAEAARAALLEECKQLEQHLGEAGSGEYREMTMLKLFDPYGDQVCVETGQKLKSFGAALCSQLPAPFCCNNPGCVNLSFVSELKLVGGKGCVCGGCQRARYCGSQCQKQHWKQHKSVCKRLR